MSKAASHRGKMEFESPDAARSAPSRHEKSLGLLTMKFVSLLQEATDGVLDLKVAADSLAVKQKRRIYDITNVMEGVGLIEKKTKNTIQWRGEKTGIQTQEAQEQVDLLKAQIAELEAQEKELDEQRTWLEENMKRLNNDPFTSVYKFVTHEDICDAFSGETLLAVMAPAGTQLEVPLPEVGQSGQKKYQMNLRSQSAPIQVTLINRDPGCSVPMVFSLPPTEEICLMPNAAPSAPACPQRVPLSVSVCSTSNAAASSSSSSYSSYSSQDSLCSMYSATNTTSSSCCSQGSACSDQQGALPERGGMLRPSPSPPDVQMACQFQPAPVSEQLPMGLSGPELQSVLDVSSLLKLNTPGEQVKDDREGAVDFIDELMSTEGIDYSFNLDENEGVCDLFDVQILNYC